MDGAVAGVATHVDFALIGHQESWRAASDVLAFLRGPEHPPLPDDEIRDADESSVTSGTRRYSP